VERLAPAVLSPFEEYIKTCCLGKRNELQSLFSLLAEKVYSHQEFLGAHSEVSNNPERAPFALNAM
jgi:hypothetical protein